MINAYIYQIAIPQAFFKTQAAPRCSGYTQCSALIQAPVFRQHTILIYQQIYQIAPVFRHRHQFSGIKSPAYTFTRLEITGPVSMQTSAAANTLIGIITQHPCSLQRSCSTQSPALNIYSSTLNLMRDEVEGAMTNIECQKKFTAPCT